MKTHNWQTKALTLFIAAVALWLATACTTYYPINYPVDGIRIISSEPCEIDMPLVPSQEFVKLADRWMQPGDDISYQALIKLSRYWASASAREFRLSPEVKRIEDMLRTYYDQFYRFPSYEFAAVEALDTWDGTPTDKLVVVVYLNHLVDLFTIPPENRIPSCIAGVPVHIVVGKYFVTVEEAGIQ